MSFSVVQKNSELYKTVYSYDNNGRLLTKKTSNATKVDSPGTVDLSAASFDVYAYNVPENAQDVKFPTWTIHNEQDDLVDPWTSGVRVSKGVWKATIPFSKHFNESGYYITHVYVDKEMFGGLATKVVEGDAKVNAPSEVSIAEKNYEVTVTGIPLQVNRILVPTWSEVNGQDDLEWIPAVNKGNGSWSAIVSLPKHGNEKGTYISHVYSYDKYGNYIGVGGTTVNVARPLVDAISEVDLAAASFDVYAFGIGPNVQSVSFPTWTTKNDQDDLERPWIQGTNMGNGTWKATILFSKHFNETGDYITHVYADGNYYAGISTTVKRGTQVIAPSSVSLGTRYYEVRITGIPQNITEVKVPTWSNHNGQDDLEWIPAVNRGNGIWSAIIDVARHGNDTGPYTSHFYYYNDQGHSIGFDGVVVNVY
ncbi:GBS Bsp-like repeat-containing protein [Paenibacillus pasadenensis]|uniref:GBS Bsp-like repeat-containing protein n=1 Tax=Paenibacillus pasadenensis TaxID=217090 RepID=UPI00203FBEA3|nr:GBS Bsp-like repeat-containing protein [Paenibacillus pasadenensis]MCM3748350.1 GBS Bsp-like repeat-containing protein [Paenibacillus pasadenensis]